MTSSQTRRGSAVVTTPSDLEIVITRQFDAPAALLFKAYTTPELVQRWWGFDDWEWLVCEIDLQVGGTWRYLTRGQTPEGEMEVGFHGVYSVIDAPNHLASTEVFEGMPDSGSQNTITFEERDGVTTLTETVLHTSQEHRDMHLQSGMDEGVNVSYDRLEALALALASETEAG